MMGLDETLFRFFNITLGSTTLAPVMKVLSDLQSFIPLILIAVLWMVFRDGTRGRVTVLMLILTVTVTDQVSSSVLKPLFGRPRPCRPEAGIEGVRTYGVGCSHRGSFPSSHAANIAGAMLVLALRYRRSAPWTLTLAFLVGYSRIFLGVHYPADVLFGWLVGGSLAWGLVALGRKGEARWRTVRGAG